MMNVSERLRKRVLQELLWVKRKFEHRIGFPRTRTQRSGTQCNGTRTRWLFELLPCRWLIERVPGNLQTKVLNRYTRPLHTRPLRVPVATIIPQEPIFLVVQVILLVENLDFSYSATRYSYSYSYSKPLNPNGSFRVRVPFH